MVARTVRKILAKLMGIRGSHLAGRSDNHKLMGKKANLAEPPIEDPGEFALDDTLRKWGSSDDRR